MKVAITGGTGLVGSYLKRRLEKRGDEVLIVSRRKKGNGYINWDPMDPDSLVFPSGIQVVIHLAGAPLFGRRWTDQYMKIVRKSRIEGTRTVGEAMKRHGEIEQFISGSAVGYYGDRGDEVLTEKSSPGEDFLADLAVDWEKESEKAGNAAGVDPAIIRTGIVLSKKGGALSQMLNPFPFIYPYHMGLGGKLGGGQQFSPWIHIADEVGLIMHIMDGELAGPFNLVAPEETRNKDFTRALGRALSRPTPLRIPKLSMKVLFGGVGELLFYSQRVRPERTIKGSYRFKYPEIEDALEDLV